MADEQTPTLDEVLTDLVVNKGVGPDEILVKVQQLKNTPVPYEVALARYVDKTTGILSPDGTIDWDKLTDYLQWTPGGRINAEYFSPFVPAMVTNAVVGKNKDLLVMAMLLALKLVK